MLNLEVHTPAAPDSTLELTSIAHAETVYTPAAHDGLQPDAPVAGTLRHVKTFDASELPKGAFLVPKDPTNPDLLHIGEVHRDRQQHVAPGMGYISVHPAAKNLIVLSDPEGNRHRIFTLGPRQQVIGWLRRRGYRLTGNATDLPIEDAPARHARQEAPVAAQAETAARTQRIAAGGEAKTPAWGWFQPAAAYPETDKLVTGGGAVRTLQAALADEKAALAASAETPTPETPSQSARTARGFSEEPGDWRETLHRRLNAEPLPLREQLIGIDDAMKVVGSELLARSLNGFQRRRVTRALNEINLTERWHKALPADHRTMKAEYMGFSPKTSTVILAALRRVVELAPEPHHLVPLMNRPYHERSDAENTRLARLQMLERLAPVAKAILKQPTILDEHAPRQFTAKPPIAKLAKKGMDLVGRGFAKLKSLRGKHQAASA